MGRYGLLGKTLGHSFSKPIHEALGGYGYDLIPLAPAGLERFLAARKFAGVNVTIPYKQAVLPYLDELDGRARQIGAVNTIVNRGGRLCGYNTDYDGFCQTLREAGFDPAGRVCLVLGSGGAGRLARAALTDLGAREVLVASRSPADGTVSYPEAESRADTALLINATPVGMFPKLNARPIDLAQFPCLQGVVDLIYNPLRTELMLQAVERGIPAANGLFMLVWQAKAAAELFLDRPVPEAAARQVWRGLYESKQNLVLIGMPTSGKSTVGWLAAKRLGRRFFDTDEAVEKRAGMSVSKIFAREGEAAFRALEREVVRGLSRESGLVIATGGGVPLVSENVENLRQNGKLVFLDRPLEQLGVGRGRPLAQTARQVAALYEKRRPIYQTVADAVLKNDEDAETAADQLYKISSNFPCVLEMQERGAAQSGRAVSR